MDNFMKKYLKIVVPIVILCIVYTIYINAFKKNYTKEEPINKKIAYHTSIINEIKIFSFTENTYCIQTYLWVKDQNNKPITLETNEFKIVKEYEIDKEQRRQLLILKDKQKIVDKILEDKWNN